MGIVSAYKIASENRAEANWVPPADKPVFVPRRSKVAAIPLDRPSLDGSSNLPGSPNGAGRSCSPIWSCSAWGFACQPHYCGCGALLPHLFTLTATVAHDGGTFSVPLSVESALSEPPRPLAGMLPYGDRTFLPRTGRNQDWAAACPAEPAFSMTAVDLAEYDKKGRSCSARVSSRNISRADCFKHRDWELASGRPVHVF